MFNLSFSLIVPITALFPRDVEFLMILMMLLTTMMFNFHLLLILIRLVLLILRTPLRPLVPFLRVQYLRVPLHPLPRLHHYKLRHLILPNYHHKFCPLVFPILFLLPLHLMLTCFYHYCSSSCWECPCSCCSRC